MAIKPRNRAALRAAALSAAAAGSTRAQIGAVIRARSAELGQVLILRGDWDNLARQVLRAVDRAKRAGNDPNTPGPSLPPPPGPRPRGTPASVYNYRVAVTYQNPDTGEKANNIITVRTAQRLTTREAVDIAMNIAGQASLFNIVESDPSRAFKEKIGSQPVAIKGQVLAIYRD